MSSHVILVTKHAPSKQFTATLDQFSNTSTNKQRAINNVEERARKAGFIREGEEVSVEDVDEEWTP